MSEIRMSTSLPAGEANGLGPVGARMVRDPHAVHVLIALVDCKQTIIDNDSGDSVPVARIRRIEAVTNPEDITTCERLVRRAIEKRTGQTVLPMDLEDELTAAFENIDPDTGEEKK